MRLYRALAKVRPEKDHPRYWDFGDHGFLSVWLFATSGDEAIERAEAIIAALPYELVDRPRYRSCELNADKTEILNPDGYEPLSTSDADVVEVTKHVAAFVLQFGLAVVWEAAPLGAEESKAFSE